MSFRIEGFEDTQITVEMEADCEYAVSINGTEAGTMKTNLGGKLSFSAELGGPEAVEVKIVKC